MSDQCGEIRNKVATLEEKVSDLKDQIAGATGTQLHSLAGRLTQALKQLANAQEALDACEATVPPAGPAVPGEGPPAGPAVPGEGPPAGPAVPGDADQCTEIRNRVATLEESVTELRDQIAGTTGAQLHGLAGLLTQALNQLARAQEALAACEGKLQPPVPPKPITIGVDRIACIRETSGLGSDEPYVLALAVDLASTVTVNAGPVQIQVPFPSLHVTRIGPWEDVDDEETHSAAELDQSDRLPLWNLAGNLQLTDPAKAIFLIALMENDDASPESVRTTLQGILTGNLFSNLTLDRNAMAQALTSAMDAGIATARLAGITFPANFDDQIGGTQALAITEVDIDRASRNGSTERHLSFSGDDAFYEVFFTISTSPLN